MTAITALTATAEVNDIWEVLAFAKEQFAKNADLQTLEVKTTKFGLCQFKPRNKFGSLTFSVEKNLENE